MARRQKQPAIILDRDGVLIDRPLLTWRKSQMKLSKGIAGEIKFFNEKKVPVIVITNQSVVARGLISEKGVVNLHELLNKRLKKSGAHVDKFYFCPHHPSANLKRYENRK
ncbi:MAG: D,D-heptose 1,7-bisphosphate phosphatase [Candidatus Jorgensenbacteria bacterium GW2011_GWC1_48_8]|uniref:D,D-heptose 1,7-bisphosphate phosphatase n=1 Tax=Candidatus Jorgensenbacteria bacterium GW2011_GWC1_48_8 TaxID=1618666 RepID=A0A0G1UWC2_9BACT|nr:MAG: D,D-heptose 1,7-bisphosphate phosphatase [Candidatus Jorgensenbacteria bacterium GW2011_GWC1_48_8]